MWSSSRKPPPGYSSRPSPRRGTWKPFSETDASAFPELCTSRSPPAAGAKPPSKRQCAFPPGEAGELRLQVLLQLYRCLGLLSSVVIATQTVPRQFQLRLILPGQVQVPPQLPRVTL